VRAFLRKDHGTPIYSAGSLFPYVVTLKDTKSKLKSVKKKVAPKYDQPAEIMADKGYHSREVLKNLEKHIKQ
jgi:hypothetical protein